MRKRKGMKKRVLSIMLCMLMVIGMIPVMPEVMQAEGLADLTDDSINVTLTDMDSNGYYDISDKDDLIAFSNLVNAGNTTINAELVNNIDMNPGFVFKADGTYDSDSSASVFTWTPIGNAGPTISPYDDMCYAGAFNGNGHIISGLYVNDSNKQNLGLFGAVVGDAKIENVGVINSYISGIGFLGGITGYQKSGLVVISNCYSDATIVGTANSVGGIAGNNMGRIINCYNTGKVNSDVNPSLVGAIAGSNSSSYSKPIENCYYLAGTASNGIPEGDSVGVAESKTAEQFASGEVAYLLNNSSCCTNGVSEVIWYQTLTGDHSQATPLFAPHCRDVVHCYVNGDTKEYKNHTHNVTYTASGATITASCDEHCAEDFGSVTVKAPTSLIYDGSSKEATKDGDLLSNNLSSITVELSYETQDGTSLGADAPWGAGTYRAVISTSISDGNVKAWVEYTIEPKELSIYTAPTPNDLTYDSTEQNLVTAGSVDSGFTMQYSLDGTNYTDMIPVATDAGTYIVYSRAVGVDNTNYVSKELDPITVTIKKAPLTIFAVSPLIVEKDYDGKTEIELSDISLSGIKGTDVVNLDISKLTAKLPSSDAGEYLKVILSGETVLTGEDAANYTIETVSGEYLLTDSVVVRPIELEVTDFWLYKDYVYTVDTLETIDLSEFLPADCGPIALSEPEITGDIDISIDSFELGDDHTLSYLVPKGEIGDTGTIRLFLNSTNYSEIYLILELKRIDKYEVTSVGAVTLKSDMLYVGGALSELEFNPMKFMANGHEIEGTLAWKDATLVPEKGTTSAAWVFTPKDTERYQTLTDTVAIGVYEAPHIQGEDGKQGWDVVLDAVADAKEGDTVNVDMNGTTVVLGDVIENIKGKDITIEFDMGNGIVWSVNGKDVTAETIADINMAVSVSTPEFPFNMIPVEVLNMVTGENYHVEINLAHNGEFGFTAVLSINLEAKNAGLFANLFYYNPTKQEMEFICADEIAADGSADLKFTHASDYTIVIDDVAGDAVVPDVPDVPANPTSPKTGEGVGFACGMMLLVLACGSVMVMRKRKNMK